MCLVEQNTGSRWGHNVENSWNDYRVETGRWTYAVKTDFKELNTVPNFFE